MRLPDDFVQHVLANQTPPEAELSFDTPVDTGWWLAQRGFRPGTSFLSPAPLGNFVTCLRDVEPSAAVLAALRGFFALQRLSLGEVRELVRDGATLVLVASVYELPRPSALARLEALGVRVTFEPR